MEDVFSQGAEANPAGVMDVHPAGRGLPLEKPSENTIMLGANLHAPYPLLVMNSIVSSMIYIL